MTGIRTIARAALLSAAALAGAAQAAPVNIFFGENTSPGQTVSGAPVTAKTSFMNALDASMTIASFENKLTGAAPPLTFAFNGSMASTITATLEGTGTVVNQASQGRYNTTAGGSKYFAATTGQNFDLTFDTGISAFGFYGTDIGDFGGQLTMLLSPTAGGPDDTLVVPNSVGPASDGALLFFGFADATKSYNKITFVTNSPTVTDFFGFDDFIVGDAGQVLVIPPDTIPEPATIALVALTLAGAGAATRRKRG